MTLDGVKPVENKNGLSVSIVFDSDDTNPVMGGDSSNPTWDEYIRGYKCKFTALATASAEQQVS